MTNTLTEQTIEFRIASRLENVGLVRLCIDALCTEHGLDPMTSFQIQSSTVEAINNSIVHAYQSDPTQNVSVRWHLLNNLLTICVSDTGRPMAQMPPMTEPPLDAESGRGWWIMRQWMDEALYSSDGKQNTVTLLKQLASTVPVNSSDT